MTADSSNVNYLYFVDYIKRIPGYRSLRVLDYGCGRGETVALLRAEQIDCYGADVSIEGTSYPELSESPLHKDGTIREIDSTGEIPFPEGFFDLIISNQVFEHVPDKVAVIRALGRVLKPDGHMYHHFPSRDVIRENHIGIPFVHWLRPGAFRTWYAATLYRLGLGHFHDARSPRRWAEEMLAWLDRYCFYEPYAAIRSEWGKDYVIEHHELEYCRFRARGNPPVRLLLRITAFRRIYESLFRRLGFQAIELRKRDGAAKVA